MKIEDQITIIDTVRILERIERQLTDGLAWLKVVAIASVLSLLAISITLAFTVIKESLSP